MKLFLITILLSIMDASLHAADRPDRDPQYDQILAALTSQIELLAPSSIKETMTTAQVWEESEKEWAGIMNNFRQMMAQAGLQSREDLVRSKDQVHEGWRRTCRVLLDRLSEKDSVLRRYDEGPEGSTGYVILIGGKPKYWLH